MAGKKLQSAKKKKMINNTIVHMNTLFIAICSCILCAGSFLLFVQTEI